MAASLCPNVTSNDTNSSAPVPIIGLYIAAATIICSGLILVDVMHAFRSRKPWIPCKFFKLDAVSLSLLAVVTKLPSDLTTPMPTSLDQLSKITGTSLICICMCYLVPSVGATSSSESFSSMIALTIFVITVVVNICIQISTHVISSFIPEHVMVMFFMLAALSLLWQSTVDINFDKTFWLEGRREYFFRRFGKRGGSLLRRLRCCFFRACIDNPQIEVVQRILGPSGVIHLVSFCCSIVELQVIFRSLIQGVRHGFFSATSDYKWSMGIIVVTQIFLILLGTLANGIRWAAMLSTLVPRSNNGKGCSFSHYFESARRLSWQIVVNSVMNCIFYLFYFPHLLAFRCVSCCCGELHIDSEGERIIDEMGLDRRDWNRWTLKNGMENMKRWMLVKKDSSPTSLIELLSNTLPSQQSLQDLEKEFKPEGFTFTSLVICEKLISISIPSTVSGFLIQKAMDEVFDIVLFVDSKVGSKSKFHAEGAKSFRGRKIEPPNYQNQPLASLDHALDTISHIKDQKTFCRKGARIVFQLIEGRQYSSIEELYKYMEQLVVDMLHIFLIQLPEAILKEVTQSSLEEYEEKTGCMLQLLMKMEPLEGKVQWSFPDNITSFITETSDTSPPSITPMGVSHAAATKDSVTIAVVQDHEITEGE